jgi:hypothetical protein
MRIAEVADHPFTLYYGLFDLGRAHLRRGDLPRATRSSGDARTSAERGRSPSGHRTSLRPSASPTPSPAVRTRRLG